MGRILHLGLGNFARAFVADYTQGCPDWRITGVSFRSASVRDGLASQGYGFTLWIDGARARKITCVDSMLVVQEDPEAIIAAAAAPETDVITLTVTEKAYALDSQGVLDLKDPAIQEDIGRGSLTPVGLLARALGRRTTPVTVLSCDNLPENGRKLAAAVHRMAEALGIEIGVDVRFPCAMVDRITPATTDAVRKAAGDPMAVPTESFSEWVIEDDFAGRRPDWPGVTWVKDVAAHEIRKLRMLNGAHSYLAYSGLNRGLTYVHEAVSDPDLRAGCAGLMAEAAATLPQAVQDQAADYARELLTRFANEALRHKLRQIAMDGSQKMPIRICATLADRQGQPSPALQAAISAWCAFVRAEIAVGRTLDDPVADKLTMACAAPNPEAALRRLIKA